MPLKVKINVALREQICQKIGSERVKCFELSSFNKSTMKLHCESKTRLVLDVLFIFLSIYLKSPINGGLWEHFSLLLYHCYARHKMTWALSVFFVRHSVLPSFRHFRLIKVVFSTPPTSLHGFEWNLVQMLYMYHKSRRSCGKIIHVRNILAELWPLILTFYTF